MDAKLLNPHAVRRTFDGLASLYDGHAALEQEVATRLLDRLEFHRLTPQRIVDLGCGTGLSFPHIIKRIGPDGHLTGVDMTTGMLSCARERCDRAGWHNVELVQSEIGSYEFPEKIDAIISTGAMGYVPEYDHVIQSAAQALAPGGRLVILDAKQPDAWPPWLFKLLFKIKKPLGLGIEFLTIARGNRSSAIFRKPRSRNGMEAGCISQSAPMLHLNSC